VWYKIASVSDDKHITDTGFRKSGGNHPTVHTSEENCFGLEATKESYPIFFKLDNDMYGTNPSTLK